MKNIEEDKIVILVMKRKDKYQIVMFIVLDLNIFLYLKYIFNVQFIYYFIYNEIDVVVVLIILQEVNYG